MSETSLLPIRENRRYGYINRKGSVVIPPQYEYAGSFAEGLANVRLSGKHGFIDTNGRIAIPPKFEEVHFGFKEGVAIVEDDFYQYCIDTTGKEVLGAGLEQVKPFVDGLAAACVDRLWGFMDRSGSFVIPPAFEDVRGFSCGLSAAKRNGRWGFVDKSGRFAIEPQYALIDSFSGDGLACVSQDARTVEYINVRGETVIGGGYAIANPFWKSRFSEGLAAVFIDGKCGAIDTKGLLVIPPIYEEIGLFSEGLAAVKINQLWGYVDRSGHVRIPAVYRYAAPFSGGLAKVTIEYMQGGSDHKEAYIDSRGEYVWTNG